MKSLQTVVMVHSQRVLLLHRHLGHAKWSLPVRGSASVSADRQERAGRLQGPCHLRGMLSLPLLHSYIV